MPMRSMTLITARQPFLVEAVLQHEVRLMAAEQLFRKIAFMRRCSKRFRQRFIHSGADNCRLKSVSVFSEKYCCGRLRKRLSGRHSRARCRTPRPAPSCDTCRSRAPEVVAPSFVRYTLVVMRFAFARADTVMPSSACGRPSDRAEQHRVARGSARTRSAIAESAAAAKAASRCRQRVSGGNSPPLLTSACSVGNDVIDFRGCEAVHGFPASGSAGPSEWSSRARLRLPLFLTTPAATSRRISAARTQRRHMNTPNTAARITLAGFTERPGGRPRRLLRAHPTSSRKQGDALTSATLATRPFERECNIRPKDAAEAFR